MLSSWKLAQRFEIDELGCRCKPALQTVLTQKRLHHFKTAPAYKRWVQVQASIADGTHTEALAAFQNRARI
jgi:hypothetical protein